MRHFIFFMCLGILILVLQGCFFSDETAGGEDFPNTIGAAIASSFSEGGGWNKMEDVSTDVPSQNIKFSYKRGVSVGPDSCVLLTVDTIADTALVKSCLESNGIRKEDTVWIINDTLFRDTIKGNETVVRLTGATFDSSTGEILSKFILEDGDDDGVVTPKPGGENKSKTTSIAFGSDTTITSIMILDAGPDEDFGSDTSEAIKDNRMIRLESHLVSKNGDTLIATLWEDSDGDGYITPVSGGENRAKISITLKLGDTVKSSVLVTGAGSDEIFNDDKINNSMDDQLIEAWDVTLSINGDTLSSSRWEDQDGDGYIYLEGGDNIARLLITNKSSDSSWINELILKPSSYNVFESDSSDPFGGNLIISVKATVFDVNDDTVQISSWVDGDGDGYISPVDSSKPALAIMSSTVISDSGRKIDSIMISAGPDWDFDLEKDNQVYFFWSLELDNNGDTLVFGEATDADGDGILLDSLIDSGMVNVVSLITGKPRISSNVTMVFFPSDSTKNYPVKFLEEKLHESGRIERSKIFGNNSDSTYSFEDTVFIYVEEIGLEDDTVAYKKAFFKAGLGSSPSLDEDNVLYSFNMVTEFNYGDEKYLDFTIVPRDPLKDGEEFKYGSIDAMIVHAPSDTFRISGTFSPDTISVELILPSENSVKVDWDKEGNPF